MRDRGNGRNGPVRVDLALVHYPVVNKNGETIGAAITNLDLHDIARAARTFGVDSLYIVSPYEDQQQMVSELLAHWLNGYGSRYNGMRGEALALIRQCADLEELYERVADKWGERPAVITTCARPQQTTWSYSRVRRMAQGGDSMLILFGTAWGLAPEVLAAADAALPPICGPERYNHLSVRAAAAIVLDRLLGIGEGT